MHYKHSGTNIRKFDVVFSSGGTKKYASYEENETTYILYNSSANQTEIRFCAFVDQLSIGDTFSFTIYDLCCYDGSFCNPSVIDSIDVKNPSLATRQLDNTSLGRYLLAYTESDIPNTYKICLARNKTNLSAYCLTFIGDLYLSMRNSWNGIYICKFKLEFCARTSINSSHNYRILRNSVTEDAAFRIKDSGAPNPSQTVPTVSLTTLSTNNNYVFSLILNITSAISYGYRIEPHFVNFDEPISADYYYGRKYLATE